MMAFIVHNLFNHNNLFKRFISKAAKESWHLKMYVVYDINILNCLFKEVPILHWNGILH